MQFSYYPGCSLHATGLEYDQSTRAVFTALGVRLVELKNWVCCGASSAHSTSGELAVSLPAINLALAQEAAHGDLLAPCAACYNRSKAADYALRSDPAERQAIEAAVGFEFSGVVKVKNPLEVVVNDIGLERVKMGVRRPLTGLRVVSYYVMQFDRPEHPVVMNHILQALGADVQEWSYAVDCCGGSGALPRSDVGRKLVSRLVLAAREAGADALVTACPLCQMNLEMRQTVTPAMPAFYFTELMGVALGLPEAKGWWSKHLVAPAPLLKAVGLLS